MDFHVRPSILTATGLSLGLWGLIGEGVVLALTGRLFF